MRYKLFFTSFTGNVEIIKDSDNSKLQDTIIHCWVFFSIVAIVRAGQISKLVESGMLILIIDYFLGKLLQLQYCADVSDFYVYLWL